MHKIHNSINEYVNRPNMIDPIPYEMIKITHAPNN